MGEDKLLEQLIKDSIFEIDEVEWAILGITWILLKSDGLSDDGVMLFDKKAAIYAKYFRTSFDNAIDYSCQFFFINIKNKTAVLEKIYNFSLPVSATALNSSE